MKTEVPSGVGIRAFFNYVDDDEELATRIAKALHGREIHVELGPEAFEAARASEEWTPDDRLVLLTSPAALEDERWLRAMKRATGEGVWRVVALAGEMGDRVLPHELSSLPLGDFSREELFAESLAWLEQALLDGVSTPPPPPPTPGETLVRLQRDGEPRDFELVFRTDAARMLLRASQIGERRSEPFTVSFTTLLIALLVPETPLGHWFRRWAEGGGLRVPPLLERGGFNDRAELDDLAASPPPDPADSRPTVTASVDRLLGRAVELAEATGPWVHGQGLALRHLVGALIYSPRFHEPDWDDLGVDRRAWSERFLWRIGQRKLDELDAWVAEHEASFGDSPDVPLGPSTHVARDLWTTDDALGYAEYAYAIFRFLTHPGTRPPLTLSVQAPWGGGKSSLMRMIQEELDPYLRHRDRDREREERSQPEGRLTLKQLLEDARGWARPGRRTLPPVPEVTWPPLLRDLNEAVEADRGRDAALSPELTLRQAYDEVRQRTNALREASGQERTPGQGTSPTLPERWDDVLHRWRSDRPGTAPEPEKDGSAGKGGAERPGQEASGEPRSERAVLEDVRARLEEIDRWIGEKGTGDVSLARASSDRFRLTVWFNAWKYESTSQVWAGLADAIIRQIAERLPTVEREKFWLRLNLRRIDPDRIRQQIHQRILTRFWTRFRGWALATGSAAVAGVSTLAVALAAGQPEGAGAGGVLLGGAVLTAAGAGWKRFRDARKSVESEPADVSLSSYLDIPDYQSELGFVHHVQADLHRVLASVPEGYLPLVIFIDDLDRSSPTKVAEVVEAVNLFLAGELPDSIFLLGMDTEMVAAALQSAHKEMVAQLPYDAATPVGWKFMDKFVQLPFLIPPPEDDDLLAYTRRLVAGDDVPATAPASPPGDRATPPPDGRTDAAPGDGTPGEGEPGGKPGGKPGAGRPDDREPSPSPPGPDTRPGVVRPAVRDWIDTEIDRFQDRSPEIRQLVAEAAVHFKNNPRELKRFVNVFRLNYFLWTARRARGQDVPTMGQLVRWCIFSMRWPEVARWLRRGGQGEWSTDGAERAEQADPGDGPPGAGEVRLQSRLLVVEELAEQSPDVKRWETDLCDRFEFPDPTPRWLHDDDLWSFLRAREDGLGESVRLSDGAHKGLW